MIATVQRIAADLLHRRQVDAVFGLAATEAGPEPRLFARPEDLADLVLEPKWLLAKTAAAILAEAPAGYRIAVVCRGCDERALIETGKRGGIDPARWEAIGVACSREQARRCLCRRPWPSRIAAGTRIEAPDPADSPLARTYLDPSGHLRRQRWREAFARCVKCYGCRNACPVCQCTPCRLEDELWVARGTVAPDMFTFHLLRAMHVADACVGCGACQEACPVGIPLALLQWPLAAALDAGYGYVAGEDEARTSPLLCDLTAEPAAGLSLPAWTDSEENENGH